MALAADVDTLVSTQSLSVRDQIHADDGLNLVELSILAVAGSPELKAQRELLEVADAQAFADGLLPDPQIALGREVPEEGDQTLVTGTLTELGYDISALLTRPARVQQRRYLLSQNRLNILWQEWQTVKQVQLLAVQNLCASDMTTLLDTVSAIRHEQETWSAPILKPKYRGWK